MVEVFLKKNTCWPILEGAILICWSSLLAPVPILQQPQYWKYAFSLKSTGETMFLRNQILRDFESALITRDYQMRQSYIDTVVVRGGATGVEMAGALAELKHYILPKEYLELDHKEVEVFLIHSGSRLLPGMSEKSLQQKNSLPIWVSTSSKHPGYGCKRSVGYLSDGRIITTRKVIWAAGITGNSTQRPGQSSVHAGQ